MLLRNYLLILSRILVGLSYCNMWDYFCRAALKNNQENDPITQEKQRLKENWDIYV